MDQSSGYDDPAFAYSMDDIYGTSNLSSGAEAGIYVDKPFSIEAVVSSYLHNNGTIYRTEYNVYFTEIISSDFARERQGVKDFGGTQYGSYILFTNGELWQTGIYTDGWQKMADNIKMIDVDANYLSHIYAVNYQNQILYAPQMATEFTMLIEEPLGDVIQIRGSVMYGVILTLMVFFVQII